MKSSISVVILTYNEELNIAKCLESVKNWADEIIIVDSYSTDKTLVIAEKYGAEVVQHPFKNQADQFNWALDNVEIKNEWILRLDADEYLTEELKKEISFSLNPLTPRFSGLRFRLGFGEKEISSSTEVNGYYIKRRVYFMGRWIKHGGYYPSWFLRLFRKGKARYEEREMDEHVVLLSGESAKLKNDFIDDNQKNLYWWTEKHNDFSNRETNERFKEMARLEEQKKLKGKLVGSQAERKRWIKQGFYFKLPLFWRAFAYFIYRYIFRLGFLDGKEGLIFHFLQGCWHQFLIDAKMYEKIKNKL